MLAMRWTAHAQDCLYVHWAIPRASAPDLPPSMSYEIHRSDGEEMIFVSVLLFRWSRHAAGEAPWWGVSFPQMHLRFYVSDASGRPSTLVQRIWMPMGMAPASTLLRRHPTRAAHCDFPKLSRQQDQESWTWRVRRRRGLALEGRLAAPVIGPGPDLGTWQQAVQHFRRRSTGYLRGWGDRVRSYQRARPGGDVLPLQVQVEGCTLLREVFPEVEEWRWREPYSAWVCPDIPLTWAEDPTVLSAEILREVWRREEPRGVVSGVPTSRNASP